MLKTWKNFELIEFGWKCSMCCCFYYLATKATDYLGGNFFFSICPIWTLAIAKGSAHKISGVFYVNF